MAERYQTVPSILLIGEDPAWRAAVSRAAALLGAEFETAGSLPDAISRLLHQEARFTHVLISCHATLQEIDAIDGLLGEAALPAALIILGGPDSHTGGGARVSSPSVEDVICALRGGIGPFPALPPLGPSDVAASLHGGGLRMRFQPILRSTDLSPVGVEALARVTHASRGILYPRDFLPYAIGCRQERMLTRIAASRLCLELRSGILGDTLSLNVNVPISGLLHVASVGRALEQCAMARIAPERVVLEVLETAALPETKAMGRAMDAWRQAGFRLAMDDAGPSLPHWRRLMDLPFDTVKLDGAMVARRESDALTAQIVDTAQRQGQYVIAEGIETEARLARMRDLGVDAVQGFLFARPLPALALPVWLRQWSAVAAMAA
jgi:EAL domain-containing protein (putative c-di-GMP-specific phosphodiesterase class I)